MTRYLIGVGVGVALVAGVTWAAGDKGRNNEQVKPMEKTAVSVLE